MQMTAQNGLYNTKTQTLTLGKEILLNSANGYEGRLTEAIIDIQNQRLVSNEPVELKTLQGKLNANRLEVTGFGEVMRFEGGVAMVLDPSKQASAKVGESTEKPAEAANTKTVTE
jgi:lipopolysaccharide export system protein LptC